MSEHTDENNNETEERREELDFDYCPIHNMYYPKGSNCPKCELERDH